MLPTRESLPGRGCTEASFNSVGNATPSRNPTVRDGIWGNIPQDVRAFTMAASMLGIVISPSFCIFETRAIRTVPLTATASTVEPLVVPSSFYMVVDMNGD